MLRERTMTDKMKILLSYIRVSEEGYSTCFVGVRIRNIVKCMMFSNSLASNRRATYVPYTIVGKMKIKRQGVLPLFKNLCKNAQASITLGIKDLDDASLYISSEEAILLII